eukprot:scaffold500421_cov31-Prasinocladus_malaysianus.AAC.1
MTRTSTYEYGTVYLLTMRLDTRTSTGTRTSSTSTSSYWSMNNLNLAQNSELGLVKLRNNGTSTRKAGVPVLYDQASWRPGTRIPYVVQFKSGQLPVRTGILTVAIRCYSYSYPVRTTRTDARLRPSVGCTRTRIRCPVSTGTSLIVRNPSSFMVRLPYYYESGTKVWYR